VALGVLGTLSIPSPEPRNLTQIGCKGEKKLLERILGIKMQLTEIVKHEGACVGRRTRRQSSEEGRAWILLELCLLQAVPT
jgi:hypothetical protein